MIPPETALWAYAFAASALFPPVPLFDGATGSASLASLAPSPGAHAHTSPWLLSPSVSGARATAYSDDYYHRLHIDPARIVAGNVIGVQEHTVKLWNAHLHASVLQDVQAISAEGISWLGAIPLHMPVLHEAQAVVRITQDGPPVIDAVLRLLFGGQHYDLQITGQRVTPWLWLPDWGAELVERYAWRTDVLTAHDGTEQRRALRIGASRQVRWSLLAHSRARRMLEHIGYGWGARVWARPDVPRGSRLSSAASTGAMSLSFPTALMRLEPGDMLMLHDGDVRAEIVEVASIATGGVTLARPTAGAWPIGTRVYRALSARLAAPIEVSYHTDDAARCDVQLQDLTHDDWPAAHGMPTYRGAPVLTLRHDWEQAPVLGMDRRMDEIDTGTGPIYWRDRTGRPQQRMTRAYWLHGRQAVDDFLQLLYWLRGRQGVIWVDTQTPDHRVVADIPGIAVTIDVERCGYALYVAADRTRRDIQIDSTAGIYRRRIIAAEDISPSVERLTIDAALGVALTVHQIRCVSTLIPCRLGSDAVEIAWVTDGLARVEVDWRSVQDEL